MAKSTGRTGDLSRPNTSVTARILRVNHGGEHGAIRIYRAQIAMARLRCPDLLPFLMDTLGHEERHLAAFRSMMPARAAKPCRAMWIWSVGGALLGGLTGLMGREAVLACTEAVEATVHRHLDDQLRYLDPRDADLAALVRDIQNEEVGHMQWARDHRRGAGQGVVHAVVAMATEGLIWLSTRGDSVRLARELRA
jgi:ubiquinone biosynthesis monooxygenase Coq7